MPLFQSRFFFAWHNLAWTETFYQVAPDCPSALNVLAGLAKLRGAILGQGASLYKYRVSQMGAPRVSMFQRFDTTPIPSPAMMPLEGQLVTLVAGPTGLYKRNYSVRGLPQDAIQAGPLGGFTGKYLPAINAYLQALLSGRWLLKVLDRSSSWVDVTGVFWLDFIAGDVIGEVLPGATPEPGNSLVVVTANNSLALPVIKDESACRTYVLVQRVKWSDAIGRQLRLVNGTHEVYWLLDNAVGWHGPFPLKGDWRSGGRVQLRRESYSTISSYALSKRGRHKCGKAPRDAFTPSTVTPSPPAAVSVPPRPPLPRFTYAPNRPWNPPGVSLRLENAQDLVALVYEGYETEPDGQRFPIRLAPVVNVPHLWVVTASGTKLDYENATGILADIDSYLGIPNKFGDGILDAIEAAIPKGDSVLLAGDSLGGMEMQNIPGDVRLSGREVAFIVTFGSPALLNPLSSQTVTRFVVPSDPVPQLPFYVANIGGGYWLWNLFGVNILPWYTLIDPSPVPLNPVLRHISYNHYTALLGYNADGSKKSTSGSRHLNLGTIQKFKAPFQ